MRQVHVDQVESGVRQQDAPVISPSHAPSGRDEQVEVRERGWLSLVRGADHRFDDPHGAVAVHRLANVTEDDPGQVVTAVHEDRRSG